MLPLWRVTNDDAHAVSEVVVRVAVRDPLPRVVRDKARHNISTKRHVHRVLHDVPAWRYRRSNPRSVCCGHENQSAASRQSTSEQRLRGTCTRRQDGGICSEMCRRRRMHVTGHPLVPLSSKQIAAIGRCADTRVYSILAYTHLMDC